MTSIEDLTKLAQKLAAEGPHKCEATPRRVRGLLNGKYVFDTINAYHVWEHPYYPQLYIPLTSLTPSATYTQTARVPHTDGNIHYGTLTVGTKTTSPILLIRTPQIPSLLKIPFAELDQWFEEDAPILPPHPKDPYKRIAILPSSRSVKVSLSGVTLAEAPNPLFLLETMLRPRYYLPPTTVKWEFLRESETVMYCPYKGKANYYHVEIGGKVYKDLVWYYQYPTQESALIGGYMCFYNEKVDVWVDGVREER
ncbi:DUF427-domain-containing protein [Byssothecium circinans]|uniref:DUF427-domain-containing protein n=1 Tax=Byssothecium circinans TaxID=147558 RepID=A0A6A5UE81_9PLEO|nr:DUF427-domain-containing protein [Byssothecium circinans]